MSKNSLKKKKDQKNRDELSSISGKEMALNYLKRNQDSDTPYYRNSSMLTSQISYDDFKNELLNCINVPEYFRKRQQEKARLK